TIRTPMAWRHKKRSIASIVREANGSVQTRAPAERPCASSLAKARRSGARQHACGVAIQHPDDFAVVGRDQLGREAIGIARPFERVFYRLRLLGPRHQEHYPCGVVDRRRRQGHAARLRGVNFHRNGDSLALVERRAAWEERGGVDVVAEPEQDQVEARKFALAESKARADFLLVGPRSLFRRPFAADAMHLIGTQAEPAEHRAVGHPEVARWIVRRHASLVAPEELYFLPIHAEAKAFGQQLVGGGRR